MLLNMEKEPGPAVDGASRGSSCANCGVPLNGPFCSACGQENRNLARIPVSEILRDWLGDAFTFDSRLARTMVPLIQRPGFLTQEYLAGRRARYVPPLRMFVFLSLVMFLVLALAGTELSFQLTGEGGEQLVASGDMARKSVEASTEAPTLDAAELNQRLLDWAPRVALVLVPAIALVLWLLHRRRQPLYMPHLIFTVHVHCFAFFLITVAKVMDLPFSEIPPGKLLLLVGLPAYLYLAQKRVYGGGWFANLLRTLVILVLQQVGFVLVMLPLLFLLGLRP